jgi:hypothetical protein
MKRANELDRLIDGIRDNTNPGEIAASINDEDTQAIGSILATICALSAIQARALTAVLERLEIEQGPKHLR